MMNEEIIAKAKKAKSVEELIALAKENGIELTEEEANTYLAQLNPKKGEISDDELDVVSGGGCETKVDGKKYTVVTSACKCFTGQYLSNFVSRENLGMTVRTDNPELRMIWVGKTGSKIENKCGSCAYLGFKDGIGYCEKS